MTRYIPVILTPVGSVDFWGSTTTPEREREVAKAATLRDMPRMGLEPSVDNLEKYFAMIREVLSCRD